ncbi:aldo/keto reductase [Archangium violaceum]|uniref:aldo/keto reductase n=1 Tax=Archangium violaceum TaxID=83451 RepID=UPI00194F4BE3|nr:aldo/keto reductase [Archangium violaceum]QRN98329.1 aldo/keto reductase [Archangium violaceum]
MTVGRQKLHPEGLELSRLVCGLWRALQSEETREPTGVARLMDVCLELGITSFDHADIYGDYQVEALFGRALREWRGDRRRIELITKCDIMLQSGQRPANRVKHYDTSRAHILASVENSLRNFGTDYLDLLLIHRPDPLMDADETAAALDEVCRSGKVRYVGVSNHTPEQLSLLQSRLSRPLVTNQVELSVLHLEPLHDGTLDQAQRLRMAPMAWSPLGGGNLFKGQGEREQRVRQALSDVAAEQGHDNLGAVAIAWLLRHPSHPVPVLGSSRVERLRDLARGESLALTRQQWFSIWQASAGRPAP